MASAAAAVILVGLGVFLITYLGRNRELRAASGRLRHAREAASAEARRAASEAERARGILSLLNVTVLSMIAEEDSGIVSIETMLGRIAEDLEDGFEGPTLDEAQLRASLGRSYLALGRYGEAALHLAAHVELLEEYAGSDEETRLTEGLRDLGGALAGLGKHREAAQAYGRGIQSFDRAGREDRALEASLALGLAQALEETGNRPTGERYAARALELTRAESESCAELELAARSAWRLGRRAEAETLLRRSLALWRAAPEETANTGRCLGELGTLLAEDGRPLEARAPMEEALELLLVRLGPDHPETVSARQNLATLLLQLGAFERAGGELEAVLESWRRLGRSAHEDFAATLSMLGVVHGELGRLEEGELCMREALDVYRASGSARSDKLAMHLSNLARVLKMRGQLEEAEELVLEATDLRREAFGEPHRTVARSLGQSGEIQLLRGDLEGAEQTFRSALEMLRRCVPTGDLDLADGSNSLAAVLHARARFEEARDLYRESLEACAAALGEGHPSTLLRMQSLGDLLQDAGDPREAEGLLRRAIELRGALGPEVRPQLATLTFSLGRCLEALADTEQPEEPLLREALSCFEQVIALRAGSGPEAESALERMDACRDRMATLNLQEDG